jgi:hypothetical protein
MILRLLRLLLLTSCLLLLVAAAEPPQNVFADGDPDEVIERGPDPREIPVPPFDPGDPWGEFGDPDEVIEGGENPFAPPGSHGMRGAENTFWLAVEAMQVTWLLMR